MGDPEGNTPGKRQVAVLLGAGASADAGIPTSVRMTDEIAEQLRDHPDSRRLLDFVRFTLAADAASQGPSTPIDIERLFTAVEMLIDRHEQPWSPFVSTWVRGLESFATRRISRAGVGGLSKLDDYIQSASAEGGSQPFGRRFGGRLNYGFDKPSKLVMNAIRGELRNLQPPDVGVQLKYVRALMIEKLLAVLQIPDPGQVAYLDPLIDLYRAQGWLTVATLNYDRSFEIAAERRRPDPQALPRPTPLPTHAEQRTRDDLTVIGDSFRNTGAAKRAAAGSSAGLHCRLAEGLFRPGPPPCWAAPDGVCVSRG